MNTGSGIRESRVLRKSVGGTLGADASSQDCASVKNATESSCAVFDIQNGEEWREAVENFRASLSILREWDERDRAKKKTDNFPFRLIDQEATDEV